MHEIVVRERRRRRSCTSFARGRSGHGRHAGRSGSAWSLKRSRSGCSRPRSSREGPSRAGRAAAGTCGSRACRPRTTSTSVSSSVFAAPMPANPPPRTSTRGRSSSSQAARLSVSTRPRPKASMRPQRPGMSSSSSRPIAVGQRRVDDQVVARRARGPSSVAQEQQRRAGRPGLRAARGRVLDRVLRWRARG